MAESGPGTPQTPQTPKTPKTRNTPDTPDTSNTPSTPKTRKKRKLTKNALKAHGVEYDGNFIYSPSDKPAEVQKSEPVGSQKLEPAGSQKLEPAGAEDCEPVGVRDLPRHVEALRKGLLNFERSLPTGWDNLRGHLEKDVTDRETRIKEIKVKETGVNEIKPELDKNNPRLVRLASDKVFEEAWSLRPPPTAWWDPPLTVQACDPGMRNFRKVMNADFDTAVDVQELQRKNEEGWVQLLRARIFRTHREIMSSRTNREVLSSRTIYDELFDQWCLEQNIMWTDINKISHCPTRLTGPKPDLTYGFPVLDSLRILPEGFSDYECATNFGHQFLADLRKGSPGLPEVRCSPSARLHKSKRADRYYDHDRMCFPWAVVEVKNARVDEREREFCYCQAANATAVAIEILESMFLGAFKFVPEDLPPIIAFTCVGPELKVWLTYRENDRDGKKKKIRMVCIWATSLELTWGIYATRMIITHMHLWATRILKPRIWACLSLIREKFRVVSPTSTAETTPVATPGSTSVADDARDEDEGQESPLARKKQRSRPALESFRPFTMDDVEPDMNNLHLSDDNQYVTADEGPSTSRKTASLEPSNCLDNLHGDRTRRETDDFERSDNNHTDDGCLTSEYEARSGEDEDFDRTDEDSAGDPASVNESYAEDCGSVAYRRGRDEDANVKAESAAEVDPGDEDVDQDRTAKPRAKSGGGHFDQKTHRYDRLVTLKALDGSAIATSEDFKSLFNTLNIQERHDLATDLWDRIMRETSVHVTSVVELETVFRRLKLSWNRDSFTSMPALRATFNKERDKARKALDGIATAGSKSKLKKTCLTLLSTLYAPSPAEALLQQGLMPRGEDWTDLGIQAFRALGCQRLKKGFRRRRDYGR